MATESSITEAEWVLLNLLWKNGKSSAPTVAALCQESQGWAYSTVKTMLDRMVDKGLTEADLVGKTWLYQAALSREDARKKAFHRLVHSAFSGSMPQLLEFLASRKALSAAQRKKLRDLLR